LRNLVPRGDAVILKLRHMLLRSGLQMLAEVNLRPGGHGTELRVTLRSEYFGAAFISLWLGFAIVFNIGVLTAALGGSARFEDLLFTMLFPIFGIGIVALNRLIAHADRARLLDFIRQTTGGEDRLVSWPA